MVSVRVTNYPALGAMAPHYHDDSSFIVVVRGAYVERLGGHDAEHATGRMLFYPAGEWHSQRFGPHGARKIVFRPEPSWLDYLRNRGIASDEPRHIDGPAIRQLSTRLLHELESDDGFAALAVDGILLELVSAFARVAMRREPVAPAWLREARDAILASPTRLSLNQLSTIVGRHPMHLAREFRRYYGTSVATYARKLRLERAAERMRARDSLSEIALACGFASQAHMTREFRRVFDVTPSEYRRRLRS
jgi:AraC family transcriptional regulator